MILTTLICLAARTVAVRMLCLYVERKWFQIDKDIVGCNALLVKSTTPWETFNLIGKNYLGGNKEVKGIAFFRQTVNYIPAGLERIFPNLREIHIRECDLLSIDKGILKPFPDLEAITLAGNLHFDTLERGLFSFNKKLKNVNLQLNFFKHIDANVLVGFRSLKPLLLSQVYCTNFEISNPGKAPMKQILGLHCQNAATEKYHLESVTRQIFHRRLVHELKRLQLKSKQLKQIENSKRNKIVRFNKLVVDVISLSRNVLEIKKRIGQ